MAGPTVRGELGDLLRQRHPGHQVSSTFREAVVRVEVDGNAAPDAVAPDGRAAGRRRWCDDRCDGQPGGDRRQRP